MKKLVFWLTKFDYMNQRLLLNIFLPVLEERFMKKLNANSTMGHLRHLIIENMTDGKLAVMCSLDFASMVCQTIQGNPNSQTVFKTLLIFKRQGFMLQVL